MSKHKEETGSKMGNLLRRGSGRQPKEEPSKNQEESSTRGSGRAGASSAGPTYPFDTEKKRKSLWLQKEQAEKLKAIARERGYRGMSHMLIDDYDLNEGA